MEVVMSVAKGSCEIASWQEDAYDEAESGVKLTRAVVEQKFTGDVVGDGAVQWLMCYRPDGTANFIGLQRITASIGDRAGSFVLEMSGEFDGKVANAEWTVVPGSATAALTGLTGTGRFVAPHGEQPTYELDYRLD
jgi:hypothetical protein